MCALVADTFAVLSVTKVSGGTRVTCDSVCHLNAANSRKASVTRAVSDDAATMLSSKSNITLASVIVNEIDTSTCINKSFRKK